MIISKVTNQSDYLENWCGTYYQQTVMGIQMFNIRILNI